MGNRPGAKLEPLTDADVAAIASAEPGNTTAALARQLGRPYFTVAKAVQRIREAGGWYCPLWPGRCVVCGRPLLGQRRQVMHVSCRPARAARRQREYRRQPDHRPSTAYVAAWRRRDPAGNARLREQDKARMREVRAEWSPERWAPLLEKVHAADQRDQAATVPLASSSGDRWTEAEDSYVLDHLDQPARDVGLELGRTMYAVRGRRVRLRRMLADQADRQDAPVAG